MTWKPNEKQTFLCQNHRILAKSCSISFKSFEFRVVFVRQVRTILVQSWSFWPSTACSLKNEKLKKRMTTFFIFFVETKNTPTIFIQTVEICYIFRVFPSDDPLDQSFQLFCFYLYTYNLSKFTEIEQKSSKNRKKLTFCSKSDKSPLENKFQKSENFEFGQNLDEILDGAGC